MASSQTHPLEHAWAFWEIRPFAGHDKKGGSAKKDRAVCEFNSIEKFWEYWHNLPRPSTLFGNGPKRVVQVDGEELKAFGLFKKGICPFWEDKANENGSRLECIKNYNGDVMDTQWENFIFGLIGEMIDEDDNVCGMRLVNQMARGQKPHQYKLELWLRKKDDDVAHRIRLKLVEALNETTTATGTNTDKRSFHKLTTEDFTLHK